VARLNAEMQRFQNTDEFRALLVKFGMEPWTPNTFEQFGEIIRNDMGRWAAVVKASGAKVD
jgi:tripartite-type tricarboxylate transporter receptor subunit TctC